MTLLLWLLAFLAGIALLEWGADAFTDRIGALARRWRAPESVVGLLTAGGEWEELLVVLVAAAGGYPGVALGNVVGSCVANLLGSFPLGAVGRPLRIDRASRRYAFVLLGVTALAAVLLADGRVGRAEGAGLLLVFAGYATSIVIVIRRGLLAPPFADDDDDDGPGEARPVAIELAILALGLGAILLGATLVIEAAVRAGRAFGIPQVVLGAVVLAFGTTLPDNVVALRAGFKGQSGVVTANALGSNIFVLLLVVGLAALFRPLALDGALDLFRLNLAALLGATLLLTLLFLRPVLDRPAALLLLAFYAAYLAANLVES